MTGAERATSQSPNSGSVRCNNDSIILAGGAGFAAGLKDGLATGLRNGEIDGAKSALNLLKNGDTVSSQIDPGPTL